MKQGSRVTLARLEPNGNAEVQLSPGTRMEAITGLIARDGGAYVDPGLGGVQLEFVGPAMAVGLREWMAADFGAVL